MMDVQTGNSACEIKSEAPIVRRLARPLPSIRFIRNVQPKEPDGSDDLKFYFGSRIVMRGRIAVALSPSERLLLLILASRGFVTTEDLMWALYGDDPEGGPEFAEDVFKQHIFRLRQVAMALGLVVRTRHSRGYEMEALDAPMRETVHVENAQESAAARSGADQPGVRRGASAVREAARLAEPA